MKKNIQNFEAQYKRSTIPLLVLYFLSQKEMYAYEIIQHTLSMSNGIYKMPLLYTTLNKLKSQGYVIESRQEISSDNRVRIYYAITQDGLEYVENFVSDFPSCNYSDIVDQFGQPELVARDFIESSDSSIPKEIARKKKHLKTLIVLLTTAILACIIYTVLISSQQQVMSDDVTIETNESN